MSSFEEHCNECEEKMGQSFAHVHKWLDEFFASGYGAEHRKMRHHLDGIEEVREMWGDQAALAAKIHIARDFFGKVPTKQEAEKWSLMGPEGVPDGGATFATDE